MSSMNYRGETGRCSSIIPAITCCKTRELFARKRASFRLCITFDRYRSGIFRDLNPMPMEILVVDDDQATRQWIGSVLEAEGYHCYQARNWQEAESFLHRGQVDLALVDIYLGADNGVDFLRRMS